MDNTSQLMADLALAQGAQWKAERERDEALELLRRVTDALGSISVVDVVGVSAIIDRGNLVREARKALAKHQPPSCERCGDKREVVMPEGGGVRTRYMAPCPECAPCERCGGERRVTYSANDGLGGVDSRDIPCPDCAEGER